MSGAVGVSTVCWRHVHSVHAHLLLDHLFQSPDNSWRQLEELCLHSGKAFPDHQAVAEQGQHVGELQGGTDVQENRHGWVCCCATADVN